MTKTYKEMAIFARRIAGQIAEVAKTEREVNTIINLIEKQFKDATIILPEYATGYMGDKVEMPQAETQGTEED